MVNLNMLKEQIRIVNEQSQLVTDANGKPMVQVPVEVWETLISQLGEEPPSSAVPQPERWKALREKWAAEPEINDEAWWNDFEKFLKANRFTVPLRDIGLDDE